MIFRRRRTGPDVFGHMPDGEQARIFTLRDAGITARVMQYGAVLQDLRIEGVGHSLVLGFPDLSGYLADEAHVGAVVGRVANRLSGGRFTVEGREYAATRNIGGRDTLHGGARGWGRRLWEVMEAKSNYAAFRLFDPDDAEGFPGEVVAVCVYRLSRSCLEVSLICRAAAATVLNPSHHHYFNLSGAGRIDDHQLEIAAERFTPLNDQLTPTGEIADVSGATDWRKPRRIGEAGIDLNYILSDAHRASPRPVAKLTAGGVAMSVSTTAPGLQVYTGHHLPADGVHGARAGICLEPQCWPDAPNNPGFPSIEVPRGQRVFQTTRFDFSVAEGRRDGMAGA